MIPRISAVLAVVVFASVIDGQNSSVDNRCFLEGGGSTLSFFVKESLPVGSIIGRLNVQGNRLFHFTSLDWVEKGNIFAEI